MPPSQASSRPLTAQQRLLLLEAWRRSGPPAGDFAPLVGLSKHTLYQWKRKFETEGPAGLMVASRTGLQQAPEAVPPRVALTHVLLQEGMDLEAAERALRTVLSLVPDHAEARNNLAVLLRQRQEHQPGQQPA